MSKSLHSVGPSRGGAHRFFIARELNPAALCPPAARWRTRRSGFTLIEAALALMLMITVLTGVYGFYAGVTRTRDQGSRYAKDALLAHYLLERVADELRHTTDLVPGDGQGFSGTHDRITLVKASMPERSVFNKYDAMKENLPPAQMDIRRVTYELVWDDQLKDDQGVAICHGLLRSEQKTFDPNPKFVVKSAQANDGQTTEQDQTQPGGEIIPVDRELLAPEIKYVRFRYFDGAEWQDRWQNAQERGTQNDNAEEEAMEQAGPGGGTDHALPQAVEITIGKERVPPDEEELNIDQFKKNEQRKGTEDYHPDRFTTIVYLMQADQSMLSSRKYSNRNNIDLQLGGGK